MSGNIPVYAVRYRECLYREGPGGEGYCYIPIAILDLRPDEDDPTEVPPTPEDDPTEVRFSFVVGALRTNRLLSRAVEILNEFLVRPVARNSLAYAYLRGYQ